MSFLAMGTIGALFMMRLHNLTLDYISHRKAGISVDDTVANWIMIILIFVFMVSMGVAVLGFPWVLMGEDYRMSPSLV